VVCRRSGWLYSAAGGLLTVHPKVVDVVARDEVVATMVDIFGDPVEEYAAPHSGIIIGHSVQPVARTGSRILHLGEPADKSDTTILGPERMAEVLH
jgi:predicted deacylase